MFNKILIESEVCDKGRYHIFGGLVGRALTLSKERDLGVALASGVILDGGLERTAIWDVVPVFGRCASVEFKPHANGADRSLLYVAMTRAEDMLVILHSGHSTYIDELDSNCDVRSEAELR